jgi:hypothetical protein
MRCQWEQPGNCRSLVRHLHQPQAPRGQLCQATPPHRPNNHTRAFGNLDLSNFLVFCFFLLAVRFHSEYFSFLHSSSSSGVATAIGTTAPAASTTAVVVAVVAAPGPVIDVLHQTPEGSLKMCWRSWRRSQRWHRSQCQRWCQRRFLWKGQ